MVLFGGKTIFDIAKNLRNKIPIKFHPIMTLNFLAAAILVILLGMLVRPILIPFDFSSSEASNGTSTSGGGPFTPGPSDKSSTSPTSSSSRWIPLLEQPAPNCNNPNGVEWYPHNQAGETYYSCSPSGLIMQQVSPHYYAEMDLEKVHDNSYSQTDFRLQVQVHFQNPGDTSTSAAIIFQTPATHGEVGGYVFGLSPNGFWQLQYVSAQGTTNVDQNVKPIDAHQSILMTVVVQDDVLYASINGQIVAPPSPDRLSLDTSSREIGLMVERTGAAPSSPIQFSNLELDEQN